MTPATPFTQSTRFADPYLKRPYSDQWNFGVQQQLNSNTVLTMNYVGSVGRKLDVGGAYNVALTLGPGTPQARAPFPHMEQMNEAIKLCGPCPQGAHLHKNLGLFYERTGDLGGAEKELRTALDLAPDDADAKSALALLERVGKEQSK